MKEQSPRPGGLRGLRDDLDSHSLRDPSKDLHDLDRRLSQWGSFIDGVGKHRIDAAFEQAWRELLDRCDARGKGLAA